MAIAFSDQAPIYISNSVVHKLLNSKIPAMAEMMSIALGRSSEYGEPIQQISLQEFSSARGISYLSNTTILDVPEQHRTVVCDKYRLIILDDLALNAMQSAALCLCAFKATAGYSENFVIMGDGLCAHYLVAGLLGESACDKVLVSTQEMASRFNDERVVPEWEQDTDEAIFYSEMPKDMPKANFVAVEKDSPEKVEQWGDGICKVMTDSPRRSWNSIYDLLHSGPAKEGTIVFLNTKSILCKNIAIKMLLDELGAE